MRQLTDEIDNIRAAWAWGIEHEKFAQLGEAGRAFGWYFEIAGLHQEGIEQLDLLTRALRARSHDSSKWNRVLGLTLIHQALLYFRKGEFDQASEFYEEGILLLQPATPNPISRCADFSRHSDAPDGQLRAGIVTRE